MTLWLPKFASQASRLEGLTLHGTATLTTRNSAGSIVSQSTASYTKTWGIGGVALPNGQDLIDTDYTLQNLAPAP